MKARLETVPDASVERNTLLPEKVPAGGLFVVRDGDPTLGGLAFGLTYGRPETSIEAAPGRMRSRARRWSSGSSTRPTHP